ncbi:MAG: ribonuclease HII [Anaerovoracaceae bacterium]
MSEVKISRIEKQKIKLQEMLEFERKFHGEGKVFIAGVDEVGRGPLAGPVVAAAVVLPVDVDILGINDSKKVSEKKRYELFDIIKDEALCYGLGIVNEKVIDEINILEATKLAMREAIKEANEMLYHKSRNNIEHLLLDAVKLDNIDIDQTSIIGGDGKSVSIAAASIMAKVTRDRMMIKYADKYPGYSFETNKGYGTKAHYEGIKEYGNTPIHRRTFLVNN